MKIKNKYTYFENMKNHSELLMTSGDHLLALNYNTNYRSPHFRLLSRK